MRPFGRDGKYILITILKVMGVCAAAGVAFFIMMKLIGPIGVIPPSWAAAYPASALPGSGFFVPALLLLMAAVLVHLFLNFLFVRKGMPVSGPLRGIVFGAAFGGLWFPGFVELIVANHAPVAPQLFNGLRDFTSFAVFGTTAGALFATGRTRPTEKRESFPVVLPVALGFALGHGIQYYFTFPALKQGVDGLPVAAWLLATGVWIGAMYYFFSPKIENAFLKAAFFAFNLFVIDWFLFDLFFNLFLDAPLFDLAVRCLSGAAGVFLGLLAYEYLRKKLRKRNAAGLETLKPDAGLAKGILDSPLPYILNKKLYFW